MSTLSNISSATNPNPSPEEQGATNGPPTSGGVTGLFEEVMAQVLSPANKNAVPDVTPDKVVAGDPKTSGKANSKSTGGSSDANSHLPMPIEPGNTIVNPEMTVSQMLAAAISMTSPTGKEVAPDVAAAQMQTGSPIKSSAATAPLPQAKGTSLAATKISASDLSDNQASPPSLVPVVQRVNQLTGKEAGLQAKNPEIPMPVDSDAGTTTLAGLVSGPSGQASKMPDSSDNTAAPLPSDPNGISIAKQVIAMKQAEKTNNLAGQTEKVLPGGIISATKANPSSYFSANSEQLTAAAAANSSPGDGSSVVSTLPMDAVAGSVTADMRTRMLERTQEMMTVNAARLSDSGNSSMQVVIKPDAGTRLSLELRQQGGNVHVQAVLQQGDFGHLNQQWSDLQQRLGLKGIQLAPLMDQGSFANSTGSETFQNKQNQTAEGVPEVSLVDAPAGMFTPEATPAPAHRGWETWA
jgi:hypothetical protein